MKEVVILIKYAQDMIKAKDYNKAKLALLKALKYDPYFDKIYLLLGNTFYLLNMKNLAYKAYLSTIHLQIQKLKNINEVSIKTIIDTKYNSLSPEVRELFSCKYGVVIFDDNIIPNHIAHVYIDFDTKDNTDPLIEEFSDLYKESLIKQESPSKLINKYNVSYEDYISFQESHFVSLGRHLLIESINWDNIDSKEVKSIYFGKGA